MSVEDLEMLGALAESRKFGPVIYRTFSWEIVEAHSYVDQGHRKGMWR